MRGSQGVRGEAANRRLIPLHSELCRRWEPRQWGAWARAGARLGEGGMVFTRLSQLTVLQMILGKMG